MGYILYRSLGDLLPKAYLDDVTVMSGKVVFTFDSKYFNDNENNQALVLFYRKEIYYLEKLSKSIRNLSFIFAPHFIFRVVSGRPMSINSPVFTIVLHDNGSVVTGTQPEPVVITFKQLQTENRTGPQCVYWDIQSG